MATLDTKYDPSGIENKWYQYWLDKGFFKSTPDDREAFTIVMPPPNVTGQLHLGHTLNNTIQDILIRRARLQGKNACWVPGTDHASIATENKVIEMLAAQGINKKDLSREEFLKHAWDWTDKYGGIILSQLKRLGASCDWDRTAFTMDKNLYDSVIKVFVDLYNKGYIYRGVRMVNWDPMRQTALSDEEVNYKEVQSKLYYVQYAIEGTSEFITIATTRPETILGDTAICVNPSDERYAHLKGKKAIVPLVNRSIPIIFDEYVDKEFGTGALKVTPAHDENDYKLGIKHNLEIIDILNSDGTISDKGQFFIGQDRFHARKAIAKQMEEEGQLVKVEEIKNKVKLATILGTWQSTLTDFKYLRKIWKDNTEEERLLGVSLTGQFGHKLMSGKEDIDKLEKVLEDLRNIARETNKGEAKKIGIQESAAITCVKPSGTVSQLVGVSSGMHPWHSQYYIRTVRGSKGDPISTFLKEVGIPVEDDVMKPTDTYVFSFPIKAPEGAIVRSDLTALDHLNTWLVYQRAWCEHKPSITVSVKEDEWMEVGAWVYKHFDEVSGISFLPHSDHTYKQAPYQEVTKEEYEDLLSKMPKSIRWEDLSFYETEDGTDASPIFACTSGECEIVDISA